MDATRFSTLGKLTRVTAYLLRFVHNVKVKSKDPAQCRNGSLQVPEVEAAEMYWVKEAQRELTNWKSQCQDLTPFVYDDVIRVDGRLKRSHSPMIKSILSFCQQTIISPP